MTFGLIQYVVGRRHLGGRKQAAEFAPAPAAISSYLLLGLGDILLETSGMSATTKLAPAAFAGQTMSLWFLSLALANGLQAQTVKLYDDVSQPAYFGVNGAIAVAAGLAVMAATRWLRRTMRPVH
ncbi:dipeptide/tripeptide permease [Streptomyces sp. V4I8]